MSGRGHSSWSADERRRRYAQAQQESTPTPEERGEDDEIGETRIAFINQRLRRTARKRPRTSTGTVLFNSSLPSPALSTQTNTEPTVRVKSEKEVQALIDLQLKSPDQRVKIYVGDQNTMCEVGLQDLDKYPVLKLLISNVGTDRPFVIHSELAKIMVDHFLSVHDSCSPTSICQRSSTTHEEKTLFQRD
jgi:hypothetical protein